MNALTRDLIKLVDMTEEMMKEKEQKEGADYREKLHLMPPVVPVEWDLSCIFSVFSI